DRRRRRVPHLLVDHPAPDQTHHGHPGHLRVPMALERLPVATGGPAITRELRAHRGPEQPAIRDRLPSHIDGHSRSHLHPRPADLHLPATLLRARRDDERHQISPTPAREPTPPRTLRPCRHEIDPLPAPPARTDLIPRTQQKAVRAPKPPRPRPHPRSRPRPRPRPRSRPRALHRCVIGVLSTENPDNATVEPPNAPKRPQTTPSSEPSSGWAGK